MARFIPAPDLWNPATRAALDAGTLTLQPGQWIKLGDGGQLSRFYRHNPATGHVVAFHGRDGWATRKLRAYVESMRYAERRKAAGLEVRPHTSPAARLYRVAGAIMRKVR